MKYALVTGGSRGIGREICKTIAADLGYHIIVNYASNAAAEMKQLQQLRPTEALQKRFNSE